MNSNYLLDFFGKKFALKIELLRNFIVTINKTASVDRFHETETK